MTEASRDEARRVELGLQADREMEAFAAEAAAAKDSDMVSWQESVEGRMEGLKGRSQGTKSLSAASGKIDSELKRLDEEEAADFSKQAHPRRPIRAEIKGQPGRTELMATGVTLLNREDYEECRELIPPAGGRSWWLRSPGIYGNMASFVGYDGDVDEIGLHVDFTESVRPALTFDPGASGLAPGDRFNALSQDWKVISEGLAICDRFIGYSCYSNNETNVYEGSEVEKFTERWYEDMLAKERDTSHKPETKIKAACEGRQGNVELGITGITLPCREDYEECREHIAPIAESWWLGSPGYFKYTAAYVDPDNNVDSGIVDDVHSVRPALTFNPGASGLAHGDRLNALSQDWTMISDRLALCDSCMGKMCFNKNMFAPDAEEYCKSDIKPSIEKWLEDRMQQEGDAVQEKERHVPYMRCDGPYPGLPPCPANAGRKQEIEL